MNIYKFNIKQSSRQYTCSLKIIPVLPFVEDEFFKSPLILVTVAMYFRPGTRSVKVNSLASLGSDLWMSKRSLSTNEMMYFSHSDTGVCHMTLREVSLACLTRSWRTAKGTEEKAWRLGSLMISDTVEYYLKSCCLLFYRHVHVFYFSISSSFFFEG